MFLCFNNNRIYGEDLIPANAFRPPGGLNGFLPISEQSVRINLATIRSIREVIESDTYLLTLAFLQILA